MRNFVLPCVEMIFILLTVKGQSSTCPVIGTDQPRLSRSTETRLFVNFESPSQCRGNVTSYTYCFYNSADEEENEVTYGAKLIVYRRSSSTGDVYRAVIGSIQKLSLPFGFVNEFRCISEPAKFEIQENDVVGACLMDSTRIRPLFLTGNTNGVNFRTYHFNRGVVDDCTDTQIGSVDSRDERFSLREDLLLHVRVHIVSDSCQVGSNPPGTAPWTSNVEGTYLNTDNPVACATENTITSWHYCYYTSPLTAGQTYTITVAVWRLDTPTNTYTLTAGSARTITLVHEATLAKIFCLEETLSSDESVFVSGGDVIGVVLPRSNPIPVVSSDSSSSSSLMRHPQTDSPADLARSEFSIISQTALHLCGNLALACATTETAASPETVASTATSSVTGEESTTTTGKDEVTTTAPILSSTTGKEHMTSNTPAPAPSTIKEDRTSSMSTSIAGEKGTSFAALGGGVAGAAVIGVFIIAAIIIVCYVQRRRSKKNVVGNDMDMSLNAMYGLNPVFFQAAEKSMEMTQNPGYNVFVSESMAANQNTANLTQNEYDVVQPDSQIDKTIEYDYVEPRQ